MSLSKVVAVLCAPAPFTAAISGPPSTQKAQGQGDVLVGRIRRDLSDPSGRSDDLFVAGDQLLKGTALDAVQIAEQLIHRG